MLTDAQKKDRCDSNKKKDEEIDERAKSTKSDEERKNPKSLQEDSSETNFPRFDPHNVERESCYPKIPKKEKDNEIRIKPKIKKRNKGMVCKIAGIFKIGCGKKDC